MNLILRLIFCTIFLSISTKGSEPDFKEQIIQVKNISIHSHPKLGADNKRYAILFVEEEVSSLDLATITDVNVMFKGKTKSIFCEAPVKNFLNRHRPDKKLYSTYNFSYSDELIENSDVTLCVKNDKSEFPKRIIIPLSFFVKHRIIDSVIYEK